MRQRANFELRVLYRISAIYWNRFAQVFSQSEKMSLRFVTLAALVLGSLGDPYQPGTPGGPWSADEIDIVREKVRLC